MIMVKNGKVLAEVIKTPLLKTVHKGQILRHTLDIGLEIEMFAVEITTGKSNALFPPAYGDKRYPY